MDETSVTKLHGVSFVVTKTEYKDKIVYRAWEQFHMELGGASFLKKPSHLHTMHHGHDKLGNVASRRWPDEIDAMTPRTVQRETAERKFRDATERLAYDVIFTRYSEAKKYIMDKGEIIKNRAFVAKDEPIYDHATPKDTVRNLLEGLSLPELERVAKVNGVSTRKEDTAGLLKMRLTNTLMAKVKKNIPINS
jgi:hypothetical protein